MQFRHRTEARPRCGAAHKWAGLVANLRASYQGHWFLQTIYVLLLSLDNFKCQKCNTWSGQFASTSTNTATTFSSISEKRERRDQTSSFLSWKPIFYGIWGSLRSELLHLFWIIVDNLREVEVGGVLHMALVFNNELVVCSVGLLHQTNRHVLKLKTKLVAVTKFRQCSIIFSKFNAYLRVFIYL